MIRPQILIHVAGGVVQNVYSSDRDADVILVDWDATREAGVNGNVVAIKLNDRPVAVHVEPIQPIPLHELAGSDVERTVEAAFEQGILAEPAY